MNRCTLYRWLASFWLDASGPGPAWVRRHLDACPACRQAWEAEQRLTAHLRAEAAVLRAQAPPPGLADRITSTVRATSREEIAPPWAERTKRWQWQIAGALAVLTLVAASLFIVRPPWPWDRSPASNTALAADPARVLAQAVNLGTGIDEWGGTIEAPLTREAQRAMQDGRAALQGLLARFVPDTAAATWTRQAGGLWGGAKRPGASGPPMKRPRSEAPGVSACVTVDNEHD